MDSLNLNTLAWLFSLILAGAVTSLAICICEVGTKKPTMKANNDVLKHKVGVRLRRELEMLKRSGMGRTTAAAVLREAIKAAYNDM